MQKLILLALLLLTAPGLWARQAELLVYRVKESGLPPYISRILVTDAFVRIDEGASSQAGYTLYNRVSHRLYNVDPEEETVLELIPPRRQPQPPADLQLSASSRPAKDAPPVAGRQVLNVELQANGRHCRRLQVVPGLMPRAVQGLRELRLALARLQGTPDEAMKQDPCALAELLYAPARHLDKGLPLVDILPEKQQLLVDFDPAFQAPEGSFQVPEGYRRVVPPPLQKQ